MSSALAIWAVTLLLGLAAVPVVRAALPGLPGATAMARPLGILLAAFPVWLLSSLGLLPYGTASAWAGTAAAVVLGAVVWRRTRENPAPERDRGLSLAAEAVFTATFLLGLYVVSHRPDIWGTERPLDMALVNVVDATRHFPPLDPWLSGHDLNYYYFGQYLMAFVIRLAGVPTDEGYNVCVALVWALAATTAFGLGAVVTRRVRGGLALTVLGVAGGNALGAHALATHDGPLARFDWFSASRAVPGTVNDFPAFELVVGDLHAHVIAVPLMFIAFALAHEVVLNGPALRPRLLLAALVLGALFATNVWSAPAALAVLAGAAAMHRAWRRAAAWTGALVAGAALLFLPFHLGISTGGTSGIHLVPERRPLGHFALDQLAMYGFSLVPALVMLGLRLPRRGALVGAAAIVAVLPLAFADDLGGPAVVAVAGLAAGWLALERKDLGMLLLAVACGCIVTAELVYLGDAFAGGDYFRFNTFFKVGFDAWLLLAAAAAILVAGSRWIWLAAVFGAAALTFPPAAAYVHTGAFKGGAHLDGLRWLEATAPGDPAAIAWIREHVPADAVVLEAVGPEYSPQGHARVSVFTGRPTVLGWAGHELFYHPADALGTREQDVRAMYAIGDPALLARYRVRYVVVGPLERATYPELDASRFGKPVFERSGTTVHALATPGQDRLPLPP
jgi:YYY domain-containing protein